jgi:hypothetical protein
LLENEDSYTVCHADAHEVKQVAAAIARITKADMRRRYNHIDPNEYGRTLCEEDFAYTWGWFVLLRKFFKKAAAHDRPVMFTV